MQGSQEAKREDRDKANPGERVNARQSHGHMRVVRMIHTNSPKAGACQHCGAPLGAGPDARFCCHGCAAAYAFIHELGLDQFYQIKDTLIDAPAPEKFGDYSFFSAPDFRKDFGKTLADGRSEFRLYLEGLHCFGCVWLCEQVMQKLAPDADVNVNLSNGVATLLVTPQTDLAPIARALAQVGHAPTPLQEAQTLRLTGDVLRLGVALFCTMNTMSFALVDYFATPGSVDAPLVALLRWLSWGLATLSLIYSAGQLLRAGTAALRRQRPNVDTGVGTALLAAYFYSTWNLWATGPVYFDSITAIIALLLTGRLLQRRLLAKIEMQLGNSDKAIYVRRRDHSGAYNFVALRQMRQGDLFQVLPGETIPLAGKVTEGAGEINWEPLTGEATPTLAVIGGQLRAGAVNLREPLTIRASEDGYQCFWYQSQRATRRLLAEKGRLTLLSDRLAGRFFWFSMTVALITFLYALAHFGLDSAVQRTMAVLLVACPCVFGFAAPLAFATCAARGLKAGIAFRSQAAIENLATAKAMVFDKTGTLTWGTPTVKKVHITRSSSARIEPSSIRLLCETAAAFSNHHATQAVGRWATQQFPSDSQFQKMSAEEVLGEGIVVKCGPHTLRLGRPEFTGTTILTESAQVYANIDNLWWAAFILDDELRPEAQDVVLSLEALGLHLSVMSGDQEPRVRQLSAQLQLPSFAELTPSGKALAINRIAAQNTVAMVGNGFNDSLAMARAQVGIAVENASSSAQGAADVQLLRPGLAALQNAVTLSRRAVTAVYSAFFFAGSYNFAAMMLAMTGHISPVVAALLMPANSLSVTLIATRWRGVRAPRGQL